MKKIKAIFCVLMMLLASIFVLAQEGAAKTGFGQTMRSNGRIYVVVAVMLTILIGLFLYLVRLDRKMSRLEKEGSLS